MLRKRAAALVVLVVAGLITGAAPAGGNQPAEPEWRACPGAPEGHPVQCATVDVPRNWETGEGKVGLQVSRLSAADPDKRIGVLMFNPGGPGTGAAGYLASPQIAEQYFGQEILERFDVVGVDPRGVAGSEAIDCAKPAYDPAINRFPADAAEVTALTEANAEFAESCVERSGELVANLDTESVARDLDAVREALGEQQISFLGISYGSMLGRSYAELFPYRLRALALDAVVDRALPASQLALDGARAVQDGIEHFARWCADNDSCELDARASIDEVQTLAERGELPAGDRKLTIRDVQLGVNGFLQSPTAYPDFTKALKAARDGDGTALSEMGMHTDPAAYRMYRSIICQDVNASNLAGGLPALGHAAQRVGPTLRGFSEFWDIASGCVGWPQEASWQPTPWQRAGELPPTLLVSGAHDVATPRSWAEQVDRQLPNSALVRWDGAGHAGWQLHSECATEATVDYLITRELPDEETTCTTV
ncbi:alpha/beta hydrolase family protein [Tamaricihabitans halophyticus]|uniref:Alpha/beta hydrolase family protein n=1 Tax=Tamaricihabitans halophyticus TaxID=1262583 RepID=A0A4R2QXN5_9PSEU|nr:alpha/beta hydrolase [Tamaricihabitans halophyticus]TCP54960.1 alpha/beta hydrolase family protein [Tamaricihabitans halophyticus]